MAGKNQTFLFEMEESQIEQLKLTQNVWDGDCLKSLLEYLSGSVYRLALNSAGKYKDAFFNFKIIINGQQSENPFPSYNSGKGFSARKNFQLEEYFRFRKPIFEISNGKPPSGDRSDGQV